MGNLFDCVIRQGFDPSVVCPPPSTVTNSISNSLIISQNYYPAYRVSYIQDLFKKFDKPGTLSEYKQYIDQYYTTTSNRPTSSQIQSFFEIPQVKNKIREFKQEEAFNYLEQYIIANYSFD